MTIRILAALLAVVVLVALVRLARADEVPVFSYDVVCVSQASLFDGLAEHDEMVVARGVTAAGYLTLILASPAGDWTLVMIDAAQQACIIDNGDGWEMALPGSGS